jgi:ankyrin repeat protein
MFAVSRRGEIGLQLIDLLVNYGADLKTVDRDGLTVLHISVESVDSFNERAALHLIQKYPDVDVNVAARSEETPLKLCARIGDLTEMVVRALLKSNQIDLDSIGEEEYPESRRRTALHIATEAGSIRIMELLLRSGAKLDAKDINVSRKLDKMECL